MGKSLDFDLVAINTLKISISFVCVSFLLTKLQIDGSQKDFIKLAEFAI